MTAKGFSSSVGQLSGAEIDICTKIRVFRKAIHPILTYHNTTGPLSIKVIRKLEVSNYQSLQTAPNYLLNVHLHFGRPSIFHGSWIENHRRNMMLNLTQELTYVAAPLGSWVVSSFH